MDFRFDDMERGLIADARAAIGRSLDLARFRTDASPVEAWRSLAADDWLHGGLSPELGGAGISLAIQAGIALEAGSALAVDDWVNNALVIPLLLGSASDRGHVPELLAHHAAAPGFLLADGRGESWLGPRSDGPTSWCFGIAPGFDAYWLEMIGTGEPTLVRVAGPAIELATDPDLALGAGRVEISGGEACRVPLSLGSEDLAGLRRAAVTLHSAALVGVAEESLRLTVEYAKLRVQYGKPIGQFQALKHMLADVRVANEIAGNAANYAALTAEDDVAAVPAARFQAVAAVMLATRTMVQVFGGMGFTWESDVHLFLKTALNGAIRFGSTDQDALLLGEHVLGAE